MDEFKSSFTVKRPAECMNRPNKS